MPSLCLVSYELINSILLAVTWKNTHGDNFFVFSLVVSVVTNIFLIEGRVEFGNSMLFFGMYFIFVWTFFHSMVEIFEILKIIKFNIEKVGLYLGNKNKIWKNFRETSSDYLNLTKSLIISSIVTEEDKILPYDRTPEESFSFLCFLLAYFSVLTDINLKEMDIPEEFRDDLWGELINFVFEEFGVNSETRKHSVLTIVNLMESISPLVVLSRQREIDDNNYIDMITKLSISTTVSLAKKIINNTRLNPENTNDIAYVKRRLGYSLDYYNSYAPDCFVKIGLVFN